MKRVPLKGILTMLLLVPSSGVAIKQRSSLNASGHLRLSGSRAFKSEPVQTLKSRYPFYHSTDDIRDELRRLAVECPGLTLESFGNGDRTIDVVTIRSRGTKPLNKNFLLFGEHARELVSPESGLHFVKSLCGETGLSEQAKVALKDNEFQIVVNGNPGSRRHVEAGDFCLRANPNGVDLNRNWDEQWKASALFESKDTNPGPKPFSEAETQIFKQVVEKFQPTTFLTVHSGTKGMYMPWAFDMKHVAKRNQPEMMHILQELDADHCECPFGAAGKEVGYSCPGTCLDWVYDQLKTPYAFAFEIYVGSDMEDDLRQRWKEKVADLGGAYLQSNVHLGHEDFKDLFQDHPSCFVQIKSASRGSDAEKSADWCFQQFNPGTSDELAAVVENWSTAYLNMAAMVVANLQHNGTKVTIKAL